jgi:hypothetical protein
MQTVNATADRNAARPEGALPPHMVQVLRDRLNDVQHLPAGPLSTVVDEDHWVFLTDLWAAIDAELTWGDVLTNGTAAEKALTIALKRLGGSDTAAGDQQLRTHAQRLAVTERVEGRTGQGRRR